MIHDTIRALFRRPSRLELLLNAMLWITMAAGHASQAPKGHFPEAQRDTSGWVIER